MFQTVDEFLLDQLVNWHVDGEGFSAHGAPPQPESSNVIHGYLTIGHAQRDGSHSWESMRNPYHGQYAHVDLDSGYQEYEPVTVSIGSVFEFGRAVVSPVAFLVTSALQTHSDTIAYYAEGPMTAQ